MPIVHWLLGRRLGRIAVTVCTGRMGDGRFVFRMLLPLVATLLFVTIGSAEPSPCDSSPCFNGGNCTSDNLITFNCTCPALHVGDLCQSAILSCGRDEPCPTSTFDCRNINETAWYCCLSYPPHECPIFLAGSSPCNSNPCQNGGTCYFNYGEGVNEYECRCANEFIGSTCTQAPSVQFVLPEIVEIENGGSSVPPPTGSGYSGAGDGGSTYMATTATLYSTPATLPTTPIQVGSGGSSGLVHSGSGISGDGDDGSTSMTSGNSSGLVHSGSGISGDGDDGSTSMTTGNSSGLVHSGSGISGDGDDGSTSMTTGNSSGLVNSGSGISGDGDDGSTSMTTGNSSGLVHSGSGISGDGDDGSTSMTTGSSSDLVHSGTEESGSGGSSGPVHSGSGISGDGDDDSTSMATTADAIPTTTTSHPCDVVQCLNGGRCVNTGASTHACLCTDPFTGAVCETLQCNCSTDFSASLLCNGSGVCSCLPGVAGRTCTHCLPGYHSLTAGKGCEVCECDVIGTQTGRVCDPLTGVCPCMDNTIGNNCSQCKPGKYGLSVVAPDGCFECVCSGKSSDCSSAKGHRLDHVIELFNNAEIIFTVSNLSISISRQTFGRSHIRVDFDSYHPDVYFEAKGMPFLGDLSASIGHNLSFTMDAVNYYHYDDFVAQSMDVAILGTDIPGVQDVVAVMTTTRKDYVYTSTTPIMIPLAPGSIWRLGSKSGPYATMADIRAVLQNVTRMAIRANFYCGLESYYCYTTLYNVRLDRAVLSDNASLPLVESVEHCNCPTGYSGLSCALCTGTEVVTPRNVFDACPDVSTANCTRYPLDPIVEQFYEDEISFTVINYTPAEAINSIEWYRFANNPSSSRIQVSRYATNPLAFFEANGTKFLGDLSTSLGHNLTFRVQWADYYGSNQVPVPQDMVIIGTDLPNVQDIVAAVAISRYSTVTVTIPLAPGSVWRVGSKSGPSATMADIRAVLQKVTRFAIQASEQHTYCSGYCYTNLYSVTLDRSSSDTCHDSKNLCNCSVQYSTSSQCNSTGACDCFPGVGGDKCNKCLPGFHSLTAGKGCEACTCDIIGTRAGKTCDPLTGLCPCKGNTFTKHCSQCKPGTYGPSSLAPNGCFECVCSGKSSNCTSAIGYFLDPVVEDFQDDEFSFTVNDNAISLTRDKSYGGILIVRPRFYNQNQTIYFAANGTQFLGDLSASIGQNLSYTISSPAFSYNRVAQSFDVVTIGTDIQDLQDIVAVMAVTFVRITTTLTIPLIPGRTWRVGSKSGPSATMADIRAVLQKVTRFDIRATFFESDYEIDLHDVTLGRAVRSGQASSTLGDLRSVEHCNCPTNYSGLSCELCSSDGPRAPDTRLNIFDTCVASSDGSGSGLTAISPSTEALLSTTLAPSTSPHPTVQIIDKPIALTVDPVQCTGSGARFYLPYEYSSVIAYGTPCLFGTPNGSATDYSDFLRSYWGNQAAQPGKEYGPLQGYCKCAGQRDDSNQRWIFDYQYDTCGTLAHSSSAGDKIHFINNMFSGRRRTTELLASTDYNATAVPLEGTELPFFHFHLTCVFDSTIQTSDGGFAVNVYQQNLTVNVTGIGMFNIASSFVSSVVPSDADPGSPNESPSQPTFDVGSLVTFEFRLTANTELYAHPVDCWMNTGHRDASPKAHVILDGCTNMDNVVIGDTLWRGNNIRYMRILYPAFAFVGQESAIYYLHCSIRVCIHGVNYDQCQPKCSAIAVGRKRRQAREQSAIVNGGTTQISDPNTLFAVSSPGFTLQPASYTSAGGRSGKGSGSAGLSPPAVSVTCLLLLCALGALLNHMYY